MPITTGTAYTHLVRGNFGPGCLNLPHVFAETGYAVGAALMSLVAAQGIYAMCPSGVCFCAVCLQM